MLLILAACTASIIIPKRYPQAAEALRNGLLFLPEQLGFMPHVMNSDIHTITIPDDRKFSLRNYPIEIDNPGDYLVFVSSDLPLEKLFLYSVPERRFVEITEFSGNMSPYDQSLADELGMPRGRIAVESAGEIWVSFRGPYAPVSESGNRSYQIDVAPDLSRTRDELAVTSFFVYATLLLWLVANAIWPI
jgi:hypothetical protein